jgi:hypothetical protein
MKIATLIFLLFGMSRIGFCQDSKSNPASDSIDIIVRFAVSKKGKVDEFQIVKMNCQCNKHLKDSIAAEVKKIIESYSYQVKQDKKGRPMTSYYQQTVRLRLEEEEK